MRLSVDIDEGSGFCGGVIRAIRRAEACLAEYGQLYSLGAIVHNEAEVARLEAAGMRVVSEDQLDTLLPGPQLLIRAHGAPPSTYERIRRRGFPIEDCTCPVVLNLQREIRRSWEEGSAIVIFGKVGHAEVLGLVGQTGGEALVIEGMSDLETAIEQGLIPMDREVSIFSQTTKNPDEYELVCAALAKAVPGLKIHRSICSQVANRHRALADFASAHDVIVFVSGKESSNGKVLCELCRENNPRTWHIDSASDVRAEWFRDGDRVGICGATSTPQWLLEEVAHKIWQFAG